MEDLYLSLLLKLRDHWRRKRVRDRGGRWLQGNSVCWTHQGSCANEPTAVVTSHTRPVKVQAASNRCMKRRVGHEVSLLASEILVIVSQLERKRQSSLSNQVLAVGRGRGGWGSISCLGFPVPCRARTHHLLFGFARERISSCKTRQEGVRFVVNEL